MNNKGILYIFVEGSDDERFFKKIIIPVLEKEYVKIELYKYAQWKKQKVNNFINAINTLDYDYIFTADMDDFTRVNQKKSFINDRYGNVNIKKIEIVIKEIESWYYAGISDKMMSRYNLTYKVDTNSMSKEEFNTIYRNKFRSRIDFMQEILKHYDKDKAIEKNESYEHFSTKYF